MQFLTWVRQHFLFAVWGWIGGAISSVGAGLLWPTITPAVVRLNHYYGSGPTILQLLLFATIFATPAALIGGLIGGRLPKEGGQSEQLLAAAILGFIAAVPFALYCLWIFTGW